VKEMLILFDVDGTLVHVAEEVAFASAFRELYGEGVDVSWPEDITASDTSFMAAVVERATGRQATPDDLATVAARFVDHLGKGILSGALSVRAVAGASEFVAACADVSSVAVATGCVEPSARLKLRHAGLDHHFPCGGFSTGEQRRSEIVLRAIEAAERHYRRRFVSSRIVSLGDGPWDVEAARELGLRFIGINESERGRARLARAGARVVLRDYADAAAIRRAIGELYS